MDISSVEHPKRTMKAWHRLENVKDVCGYLSSVSFFSSSRRASVLSNCAMCSLKPFLNSLRSSFSYSGSILRVSSNKYRVKYRLFVLNLSRRCGFSTKSILWVKSRTIFFPSPSICFLEQSALYLTICQSLGGGSLLYLPMRFSNLTRFFVIRNVFELIRCR